jgi:hypothetical protein
LFFTLQIGNCTQTDSGSNHPKCLLRRALGREPTADDFADVAKHSDPSTLRRTCPLSFVPFADDAEDAAAFIRSADP